MVIHCPTNEFYGHADIFRSYAGIEKKIPINGRLQHGWGPEAAVIAGDSLDRDGINFFVWTNKHAKYGYNIDRHDYPLDPKRTFVIGAPILYLQWSNIYSSSGVLAIPSHSITTKKIPVETWTNYCRHILYTYGCKTDILAHPRDIENGYDKIIKEFGLGVKTCGKMSDPAYLRNQIAIIQSYNYVISNCIQTAVFHALLLGKYVLIDAGPETATEIVDVNPIVHDKKWIQKEFPELIKGTQDIEIAYRELGEELSPLRIRELMFPHA